MTRRRILFLAHRFHEFNHLHDEKSRNLDIKSEERPLYKEIRTELEMFGDVMSERTSGIFTRVNTPPEGVARPSGFFRDSVFIEDPASHPSTSSALDEREREIRDIQTKLLNSVAVAHCVVAVVDGESETRGSLIEHAHMLGKPVLLLQQETSIRTGVRPLYRNRPGITFVIYTPESKDSALTQLKLAINRFFNKIPLSSMAG
jgi:hypothetical protein